MIRRPTDPAEALKWHRLALLGSLGPVYADEPQCGWYQVRKRRNEAFVPAVIFWESHVDVNGELIADEILRCKISGVWQCPFREWSWLAKRPISKSRYEQMMLEIAEEEAGLRSRAERTDEGSIAAFNPNTAPVPLPF